MKQRTHRAKCRLYICSGGQQLPTGRTSNILIIGYHGTPGFYPTNLETLGFHGERRVSQ